MNECTTELKSIIANNVPALVLQTGDAAAALDTIQSIAQEMHKVLIVWEHGHVRCGIERVSESAKNPYLEQIKEKLAVTSYPENTIRKYAEASYSKNCILVMKGVPITNDIEKIDRDIVDAIASLKMCDMEEKTVIFLLDGSLHKDVLPHVVVVRNPRLFPGRREVEILLDDIAKAQNLTAGSSYVPSIALINAVLGLTEREIRHAISSAILRHGKLTEEEVPLILSTKIEKVQEMEGLVYHESCGDDVGGLNGIKQWLEERKILYSPEARAYGLPTPKGIFLVGPPGCGKSLSAKMIARTLKMPLFEFDHTALFSRYVGDGEKATKEMFAFLNICGPCVLWIDEIEKILPAPSTNVHETTLRLTGMLLTWLQERGPESEVFVVCTSNNPAEVPVELLRKGRLDQLFYLDLPTESERREILSIHLNRIHKHLEEEEIVSLCAISEGYSGAEIAAAIDTANLKSYIRDKQFLASDVKFAILNDPPLSKRDSASISMQRLLAMKYGVSASTGKSSVEEQADPEVLESIESVSCVEVDYTYQ